MPTADEILSVIAPEFDSVAAEDRALVIELADAEVSTTLFPALVRLRAVALKAADMLSRAAGGSAGAVTSETVGPLSITYGTSGGGATGSNYGSDFAALVRAYSFGPRTRVG